MAENLAAVRPRFTICIPAYNRAHHLRALLDSILSQSFRSFEIVIAEDQSRERATIAEITRCVAEQYPGRVMLHENERNLGYDANIRNLVALARGEYCFFMGNDDIMCPDALANVSSIIDRHENVGLVLKSYSWFDNTPQQINQTVRYFEEETTFKSGEQAISVCFRRSGVISGYIVHRDTALRAATSKFDGTLYYQMHLTAFILAERDAVATPEVLVLCRNSEPPEFGNSAAEKGKYTPGRYTPAARLRMISGALSIVHELKASHGLNVIDVITRDYANYFYPYIKDQLELPLPEYWRLYRSFGKLGFSKYPLFHLYFLIGYTLGERRFDLMTKWVRARLGRSPHFGISSPPKPISK